MWLRRRFRVLTLMGMLLTGCSWNEMAVDTTASILVAAQESTRGYFDWESAGIAAASGIMQLEGLHTISPDNEGLSLVIVKSYMAYAYGWVQDAREEAELKGDVVAAEHHQQRAYLMYSRARNLAMRVLTLRDERFPHMARKDPATFRAYLEEEFDDAEDDVEALFWLMMSWSSAVNNSPTMDDFVDMPAIRTLADWVRVLDETYEDAGALIFLGGFDSSYPKQLGGDPVRGKAYFERALAMTERRNHVYLFNYATLYAVNAQDKALFVSLMNEIINAPDQGHQYRLPNKVAKRRALRHLKRVHEFFND
jgi:TRAP transporter T-component